MSDKPPTIISAKDLFDRCNKRDIIGCTLSTDISLGGGVPLGCTVLVAGPPKMGKTSMILQFAANAQKKYGSKIFYFPVEGRLTSKVLGQIRGIDLEKLKIVMPPEITDKNDVVTGHEKWPGEKWWDAIGQTIVDNPKSILIVDSIANMTTEKEYSEGMGYQDRGARQKAESQFCRKYGDLVIKNEVTLFLMTQMQANTSGYGSPFQMKVGNHIKFQSDIIMLGKKIEKWPEQNGKILGQDCIFMVEESALGAPHMEARVPLRYGYGIDNLMDIVNHAITWELIKKGGSWYELPFVESGKGKFKYTTTATKEDEPIKVQGEHAARNWLLLNSKEAETLDKEIRKLVFGEIPDAKVPEKVSKVHDSKD